MSDDKIIPMRPRAQEQPASAGASLIEQMQNSPNAGQTNAGPPLEIGNLGFEDIDAAFNMRAWLQKACESAGGRMTGGGFGGGSADLWIELEGHEYMVSIKPVKRPTGAGEQTGD